MAVTNDTSVAGALDSTATIDLADILNDDGSPTVPQGTTVDLTVAGDRTGYVIDFERRGDRFVVEGAGSSAELTAVYGDGDGTRTLERVPGWIVAVLEEFDIKEVSIRR